MLVVAMFTVAGAIYVWMRHYGDPDNGNRIPTIGTPKGKEARLVGVPIILLLFGIIALQIFSDRNDTD